MSLYKRAFGDQPSDVPQYELPSWTFLVVVANLIVFLPLLLIVSIRALKSDRAGLLSSSLTFGSAAVVIHLPECLPDSGHHRG